MALTQAGPVTALRTPGTQVVLMGTGTHPAGSDLPGVPAVVSTLADLGRVLVERCGLAEENLRTVVDPQTPSELGNALADQAEQADGVLLVYYVGHGLLSPSGELYLVTGATDRRPTRLGTTALSYAQVRNCLLESPAQSIVVILDCCFSGRAIGALGSPEAEIAAFAHVSGGFVLTSAARDEAALAPPGARHTVFTGELIRLLAAGDPQGPREFTLRDVYRYLNRMLPAQGMPRPHRQASEGADDLVLALNPAWQQPTAAPTPPEPVSHDGKAVDVCPYPGLAAFGPDQAQWFFGRERATAELVGRLTERLDGTGPLIVAAPSGTGKSSLLRAGLSPALNRGVFPVPGARSWPHMVFTPTASPVFELATQVALLVGVDLRMVYEELASGRSQLADILRWKLAVWSDGRARGDSRVVIVIDQFEETFTLCAEETQRQLFIRALCAAATSTDGRPAPALVVLGLRADFYGRCATYPELVATLRHGQVLLGAMTTVELRDAIEKPANAVDLTLQPGLVEVLLRDLGVEDSGTHEITYDPGRLPLLSHALLATWQQRDGNTLTLDGYKLTGGIRGAIAITAERTYQHLDPAGQHISRHLLLRMIEIGEGAEDIRRRIGLDRLVAESADPATAQVVLYTLAHARLVTLDATTAEITHEALLRAWPRLRSWIDADRAGLLIRQQLTNAAEAWYREGNHPSLLYQGPRLAVARDWANTVGHRADLTPVAQHFLTASIQREHDEQRTARHRTRRLRQLAAALAVLLLFVTTTTFIAIRSQQDAREQRNIALSQTVANDAMELRTTNPALAVQLSLAAYRLRPTTDARSSLLSAFATPYATQVTGHNDVVDSVAFSPTHGSVLATGSADGTVRLWNVTNPHHPAELGVLTGHNGVSSVAFSPDGKTLAAGGADGMVRLWDVTKPGAPADLSTPPTDHKSVSSVAFSPDGKTLAAGGADGIVRLWDVTNPGAPTGLNTPPTNYKGAVTSVAFSPNGNTLAAGNADYTVRLWDVTKPGAPADLGTLPANYKGVVSSVAFSPDGNRLAAGSADYTVRLWDVTDPRQPKPWGEPLSQTNPVTSVAFSHDGKTLAAGIADYTTQLWDVTKPAENGLVYLNQRGTLPGHTNTVSSVAFSPVGNTLATASADHTVRLWNIRGPVLAGHTNTVQSVAFGPGGLMLATATAASAVWLWDITDTWKPNILGTPVKVLEQPDAAVGSVAFSPDRKTLATGSADGKAWLWDVGDPRRPRKLGELDNHDKTAVYMVAFSPAESPGEPMVATASADGKARLWGVGNRDRPTELAELVGHENELSAVSFSPDGQLLATGSADGTARLWDLQGKQLGVIRGHTGAVRSVAFNPHDGHILATAGADSTVRLWDITNPQQPSPLAILTDHTNAVQSVAFNPDNGHTLATGSVDHTVRLWDITNPQRPSPLAILTGHTNTVLSVAFSSDGHTLATGSVDRTALLWETDVERVAARVCDVAYPRISPAEWTQYFPGLSYQPPC